MAGWWETYTPEEFATSATRDLRALDDTSVAGMLWDRSEALPRLESGKHPLVVSAFLLRASRAVRYRGNMNLHPSSLEALATDGLAFGLHLTQNWWSFYEVYEPALSGEIFVQARMRERLELGASVTIPPDTQLLPLLPQGKAKLPTPPFLFYGIVVGLEEGKKLERVMLRSHSRTYLTALTSELTLSSETCAFAAGAT